MGLSVAALVALTVVLMAFTPTLSPAPTHEIQVHLQRAPDVPDLPFPDNPDPLQCGIPVQWGKGDPAWLTGYYQGKLLQPTVFLYDSHLRQSIAGAAPSGAMVRVVLYQRNPTLDYYMVETIGLDDVQRGWVPAPFLQFEPPQ
jgi:hypothetical protein